MIVQTQNDLNTYVNVSCIDPSMQDASQYRVKVIIEKVQSASKKIAPVSNTGSNFDQYG